MNKSILRALVPALAGTALGWSAPVGAAVTINGIRFQDRNATGRTALGAFRGSLGVIDYDNDGYMDLVIADASNRPNHLFHNEPDPGEAGNRTLVERTAGSGLDDADSIVRGAGAVAVADIDNDGFQDIYVQGAAFDGTSGLLYRNNGNGTFSNISAGSGVRIGGDTQDSASFTDFDHDGFVDLLVCNLGGTRAYRLYRNNHNNTFTLQTALVPATGTGQRIYSHGWGDFDNDGWDDAFVLGSGTPALLRNVANPAGGRMLIDGAQAAGFTHLGPAPMGIAFGDFDNDGDLDLSITDAVRGTYYRNDSGAMSEFLPFGTFFGWGTLWIDADNDGLLDNYQAGSYGSSAVDHLTRNLGNGQWQDVSGALNTTPLASQYSVQVDLNNDGRRDIITINPNVSVSVYENLSTTGNHWLTVKAVGTGIVNRDAIGARVRALAGGQWRVGQVQSGSSTTSSEDLRVHFGLGPVARVDRVEIDWPVPPEIGNSGSGRRTSVYAGPFAADQFLTLTPACTGDLNADRSVNTSDLTGLLARFGDAGTGLGAADLNADGAVNTQDLTMLLSVFGAGCP